MIKHHLDKLLIKLILLGRVSCNYVSVCLSICLYGLPQTQASNTSEPSLSNDSDSSNGSHYRRKQLKNKKHRKKDTIKQCATLTEKLLTKAYKSKIIRFKMDEDPLQRRIYFLTFVELLEMIFSQFTETCEGDSRLSKNRRG